MCAKINTRQSFDTCCKKKAINNSENIYCIIKKYWNVVKTRRYALGEEKLWHLHWLSKARDCLEKLRALIWQNY